MPPSQPPPLRRTPTSSSPASTPAELNIVERIQHANARLAASAAARARSRDDERRQRSDVSSVALTASALTSLSPHPRLPSPSLQLMLQQQQRQNSDLLRCSISPPESVTTAGPSSSSRPWTASPLSANVSSRITNAATSSSLSPSVMRSPSLTATATATTSPPRSRHVTAYVDMSPSPETKSTASPRLESTSTARNALIRDLEKAATERSSRQLKGTKDTEEELRQTRQQLEDLQRLYSYEKKAHLQQRTQQLRDEARQRHNGEDIVAQAAQLLTDYEALIHFRDAASAEHLEAVMQRISQEWKRCAAELEETREACATSLLCRLQTSCAQQQESLKKAMQEHLVTVSTNTVEAEAQQFQTIAAAVQDQVESFKTEYRAIIDQDMEERRRLMDAQASHREQQWLKFLKEEHARMIAAGETAAREASRRQLETLHLAMRDITELREKLLKEHAQRQAEMGQEYLDSYSSLAEEYATAAQETVEYVQRLQQEYSVIIKRLHNEVSRVVAERQMAAQQEQQIALHTQEAIAEQQHVIESNLNARWQKKFAEEREAHRTTLANLILTHENDLHKLQTSYNEKETAHIAAYEKELTGLREQLAQQRAEHAAQVDSASDTLKVAIHRLEKEKEVLWQEMLALKEQQLQEANAHEAELRNVQREEEKRFAARLQELDTNYAAALQQHRKRLEEVKMNEKEESGACTKAAAASVHALQRVAELEEEIQHVQHQHAIELQEAIDSITSSWSSRLKEAQQRQAEERNALETQYRNLRQSLLEEVRGRENAVEARCAAQSEAYQRELQEAVLAEKQEARRALERLKHEFAIKRDQLEAEAAAQAQLREEAVAERERRVSEAEVACQRRCAKEHDDLLKALQLHVAAEAEAQQCLLREREAQLHAAQEAFVKQQLSTSQETRRKIREEEAAKFSAQLKDSQQQWMQLVEDEARQRYAVWQEARKLELDIVHALHQKEIDLLRHFYERQLQLLHDERVEHGNKIEQEMLARERAWATARAASLDAYDKAAAERLDDVLAREKTAWEAAQQQRASVAAASLESAAQRAEEVLAATEKDRWRMENELRDVYVAVINDQEVRIAQHLTELHAKHEKELIHLRQENEERLCQQARQLQEEFAEQMRQQNAHLAKMTKAHEAEMTALRTEHAKQLAEERTATHEALLQAHKQANDTQRIHESLIKAAQQEAEQAHQHRLSELQRRCDAQAAQLIRVDADMCNQAQRIREEQQTQLRQEYERSIESLRDALEARNQSYASLQASLFEQVQREATRIQSKMEAAYAAFAAEQTKIMADRLEANETAQVEQQQRQQEQLARLHQQHQAALSAQAQKLRTEHNDACAKLKAFYESQQQEWEQLLKTAHAERETAECQVKSLTVQLAQLPLTQQQQRAATYRALDEQYAHLLEEAVTQLQAEREDVARRSLEAAEEHFVSEMMLLRRRDDRAQGKEEIEQQEHASHPVSLSRLLQPSFTTPLTRAVYTPSNDVSFSNDVPPALYLSRNVSTPAVSRTPRSFTSPPPISPAAPVEIAETPELLPPSSPSQLPQQKRDDYQQRLQQLWEVLEVPLEERHAFLDHIDSLSDDPQGQGYQQQQQAWRAEQQRLEAQLPLLEALTRREYVEQQLRALRKNPPLSSMEMNRSPRRKREKTSIEDCEEDQCNDISRNTASSPPQVYDRLAGELQCLTAQLRRDVEAHETQYGRPFFYNGRRVVETLGK